MIAAARANGVWLSVNFHAQVDPLCQAARDLVAQGAIGQVVGTRIVFRGDKPASYWTSGYSGRVATDWRVKKATAGGGVLIMNAIHDLNTMRFITGLEAVRVYAEYGTFDTPVEVEDFIAVTYRYDNDAIGTIEAGSAIRGRDPLHDVDRIYGTAGQILLGEPLADLHHGGHGRTPDQPMAGAARRTFDRRGAADGHGRWVRRTDRFGRCADGRRGRRSRRPRHRPGSVSIGSRGPTDHARRQSSRGSMDGDEDSPSSPSHCRSGRPRRRSGIWRSWGTTGSSGGSPTTRHARRRGSGRETAAPFP